MSFEKEPSNFKINIPKRLDDEKADKKIKEAIDFKLLEERIETHFLKRKKVINVLARLILELKENIIDYDTILSDDASGRLVSLLLRKIINQQRKKVGKKQINTYFLASGQNRGPKDIDALREFIISKKEKLGKTLLVTEYIETGDGITYLVKILKQVGINFNVATVSIRYNLGGKEYADYDPDLITRLKYGSYGEIGRQAFYGNQSYTGVTKGCCSYCTAFPAHPGVSGYQDRRLIKQARQDIDVLANELS
ncbi:MAG: hypothetical protein KAS12_00170, partial [Candidatus Aenigmarchaeota archaeon]|nr:hypothetical protein [Candidatus Aenigmarchaeota archaeon]